MILIAVEFSLINYENVMSIVLLIITKQNKEKE